MNRAVFFDRDGTLCEDVGYLDTWDNFKVISDITSIKLLINNAIILIGVTNQSGIARGYVEERFVREVNGYFMENHGFADFYYCPHHPDEGCDCRKPNPGMLLKAKTEHDIDLRRSYVVGDKETDMLLAIAVGAKAVLVQTGKEKESTTADFVARNLAETVRFILDDE